MNKQLSTMSNFFLLFFIPFFYLSAAEQDHSFFQVKKKNYNHIPQNEEELLDYLEKYLEKNKTHNFEEINKQLVNTHFFDGTTPLHLAIKFGSLSLVNLLLVEIGADPLVKVETPEIRPTTRITSRRVHSDGRSHKINRKKGEKVPGVRLSKRRKSLPTTGAEINTTELVKDSIALHLAAHFNQPTIAVILLNQGPLEQICMQDCNNNTPLHIAVEQGNVEIAKKLIEGPSEGENINFYSVYLTNAFYTANIHTMTPISLVLELDDKNSFAILEKMIERGLDVNHYLPTKRRPAKLIENSLRKKQERNVLLLVVNGAIVPPKYTHLKALQDYLNQDKNKFIQWIQEVLEQDTSLDDFSADEIARIYLQKKLIKKREKDQQPKSPRGRIFGLSRSKTSGIFSLPKQ